MKASELIGPALDWAVAKCDGYFDIDMAVVRNGVVRVHYFDKWAPATDWSQGGPIIEREGIAVTRSIESWCAYSAEGTHEVRERTMLRWARKQTGPTPLVAAMRCYVASKLGDEVDIPAELID